MVGINPWVAHYNREVFGSDADTFRPERWLADKETVRKMDEYYIPVSFIPCFLYFTNAIAVWSWLQNLHRQKYQSLADFKDSPASYASLQLSLRRPGSRARDRYGAIRLADELFL